MIKVNIKNIMEFCHSRVCNDYILHKDNISHSLSDFCLHLVIVSVNVAHKNITYGVIIQFCSLIKACVHIAT